MSAQGSADYKLTWYAELQGDAKVKAQMEALLDVQQRGRQAESANLAIARDARAELLEHSRATNTLMRSWELAHPQLDLFSRSMSGLGSAAHAVLSVMNSINLLTISQSEKQQTLRDVQAKLIEDTVKYNDALAAFGATAPQTVKALEDVRKDQLELKKATSAVNDSWKEWVVTIASVMVVLGQMRRVLTDITGMIVLLKALDLGPLGAAFIMLARNLPVIAAIAPGIAILIDNLMKVTSLQDLWNKFAQDNPLFKIAEDAYRSLIRMKSDLVAFGIIVNRDWQEIWKKIFKFGDDIRLFFTEIIPNWFNQTFTKMGEIASRKVRDIIGIFEALKQGAWDKVYALANDLVFGSLWPNMLDKMSDVTGEKLGNIQDQFIGFKDKVTDALVGTGDTFSGAVDKASASLSGSVVSLAGAISNLSDAIKAQEAARMLPIIAGQRFNAANVNTGPIDAQIAQVGAARNAAGLQSQYDILNTKLYALVDQRDSLIKSAQKIFGSGQGLAIAQLQQQISAGGFTGVSPAVMTMITAPMQQQIFQAQQQAQIAGIAAFNQSLQLPSHDVVNQSFVDSLRSRGYTGPVTNPNYNTYQGRPITVNQYVQGSLITQQDLHANISHAIAVGTAGQIR